MWSFQILHCDVIGPAQASRHHTAGNVGTHGWIARRENRLTELCSVSEMFTVAHLMLVHFRGGEKKGGIPFEAGSSAMRKCGLQ